MRRLLNPVYRGDPEPERTFRLLRRFQATGHLPGSLPSFLIFDLEEEPAQADIVMADNNIIGIANDRARNIKDYMMQAIGQYSSDANEDPHLHLSLRSGNEYEGSTSTSEESPKENLTTLDTLDKEVSQSTEDIIVLEPTDEPTTPDKSSLKTPVMTSNPEKQPMVMP
ncbi:hypothetical protein KIW84_057459 [Lathyrus oleraceus]|uniref:Uncharacterized protein n=1 Tax=Pisum sativum TaxID=3888 RepID=A0A9D5AL30_PEA|nr:hypothetical protein KIW84_057459 [Pisum sativum]